MRSEWGTRPALDGLRTLAVYLVLLFHAGVVAFDGGFLGVDLFFVLSGLLVTSILLQEIDTHGRVRLLRFYARRVRRLLPAAVVVVVAVSAFFMLVSTSVARAPWVTDGQSALLYWSNWRFISQADDYFAADFNSSPFLHFWSLSIEEQFYFVFPLVLTGLAVLGRRWRWAVPAGLLVLCLASVAAQVAWAQVDPTRAYYGTDARLYQLLAGALLAWWWRTFRMTAAAEQRAAAAPRARVGATTLLVVTFVVVASGAFEASASVRGLVATGLAVLLLVAVLNERDRFAHWVLTRRPVTYLGRISYGTYLWHWPVVLGLGVLLDIGPWALAGLTFLLATGLAAVSAELLEQPLRFSPRLSRVHRTSVAVGLALSVVAALTVVPSLLGSDRRPAVNLASAGVSANTSANRDRRVPRGLDLPAVAANLGLGSTCTDDDRTSCVVHEGSGPTVALIGDSYARSLAPAMVELAKEHDFTLVLSAFGGCSWQQGVTTQDPVESGVDYCKRARDLYYDGGLLAELGVDVTLLVQTPRDWGKWHRNLRAADGSRTDINKLNRRTMSATVRAIRGQGSTVVLMRSWIRPDFAGVQDPLDCLAAAERTAQCRVPAPRGSHVSDAIYDNIALGQPGVTTVDINDVMCPAWPVCEPLIGRTPVWRDEGHYSTEILVEKRGEIWERLVATGQFGDA